MNLADLIDRNADLAPDKAAIRFGGSELTYAALAQRISETARALKSQLGIVRGDRVAILAANHPDYLVLLYACARLGAMLVPINWRLAVPEQLFILRDAGVKALVVEQAFAPIVEPLAAAYRACASSASIFRAGRRYLVFRAAAESAAATRRQRAASIQPAPCSSSTPRARPAIPRARCCARTRWWRTPP